MATTRREFLTLAATTTAALASWRLLSGCGGDDDSQASQSVSHDLFFDFQHETDANDATYHVVVGGRRYPLERAQSHHLDNARQTNKFLQGVPDESLTHVLQNFPTLRDFLQIAYVVKNPSKDGTWAMSSLFFILPPSSVAAAHEFALQTLQSSSTTQKASAKRRRYGVSAAATQQDALDEEWLASPSDHATALVSLHNELLCGHPDTAAYIQKQVVQQYGDVDLDRLTDAITATGAAAPEPGGWATLMPIVDPSTNKPLVFDKGSNAGLIAYQPKWGPEVQGSAKRAITRVLQAAKDDTSLGADITSLDTGPAGTIWHRRDGITNIDVSGLQAEPSSATLVITPGTPFNGYSCDAEIEDGQITLDLSNWYVRWLAIWFEFVGKRSDGTVGPIPWEELPSDFDQYQEKTGSVLFAGAMSPEFTIFGIPTKASDLSVSFPMPPQATRVNVIASGLGAGTITRPDTIGLGVAFTVLLNLLIPTVLLATGAGAVLSELKEDFDDMIEEIEITAKAKEVFNALVELFQSSGVEDFFARLGTILGLVIAGKATEKFVELAVEKMFIRVTEAEAEDCIPIVGQVVEAIGALGTAAELIQTSAEVATSPWSYESSLDPVHDVTVKIVPEDGGTLPAGVTHCVITAIFGNGGTPRTIKRDLQDADTEVPVTFGSVPFGSSITVNAGFYGADEALLGQATSGPVDNTVNDLADIKIKRVAHPITQNTKYVHNRKTALNDSQHEWIVTPTPPTETVDDVNCAGDAGSICDGFRGITVRQESPQLPGYVGYGWKGFVTGCSGGSGPVDRLSALNTPDSKAGYDTVACGFPPTGAKIAFSLIGQTDLNYYYDPDTKQVYRVSLGTEPQFADAIPAEALGQLNFESDALVLHPTGILVSVSNANHRLETLKPPDAPLRPVSPLLANVYGGQGKRPGLLNLPVAAAVSSDGTILVLEDGNNRIQAFDIGGNAAKFFKNQPDPYFLNLTATKSPRFDKDPSNDQYLDIAVEHSGFVYVLSYNNANRTGTFPYRLDVYSQNQSGTAPISTTTGFNAAKLTVDLWRVVYTLNYEVLKNGQTPAGEPSISEWLPQGM